MNENNIRMRISWKDTTLTGFQFLKQTFDFLLKLTKSQNELKNLRIYDDVKATPYYEEDVSVDGEQLMRPLSLNRDDYSKTVVECLGERSYCRGFQSFTNEGVPYQRFSSYFTFDKRNARNEVIIKFRLSDQLDFSTVEIELGDSYNQEGEVREIFMLLVQFWHPLYGICGPYLEPGRDPRDPSLYRKYRVDWLTYRNFPAFGDALPSNYKRHQCADGQIIEVVGATCFARNSSGKSLIRDLFNLLDRAGQLDMKEIVQTSPNITP